MKKKNLLIFLLFILICLNYNKIIKKIKGGIKLLETYDNELENIKNNYRIIIHNIIRMENILNYNPHFANNDSFTIKLDNLKIQKTNQHNRLSNILDSNEKVKNIENELIKEETILADKYARHFTAKLILNKTLNKNVNNEINAIKLL